MEREELLEKYAKGDKDFTGIILCEINLSRANLNQANLSHAILNLCNFSGANLSEANLNGAKLNVARLSGINLSHAKLNGTTLNVANLIRANLTNAELIEANLIRAELIRADLSNANLKGSNLTEVDLREAILRNANLQLVDLSSARLRGSSLVSANLERANLHRADLSKADLRKVNFTNAELRQANLSLSNLSQANLKGANLRWADLTGANLSEANLDSAILSAVNLYGANLHGANLSNAVLVHADLSKTNLIHATWEGADLTAATLTGSKLYEVSRYGLTAEDITCDWVDISPNGDASQILNFTPEQAQKFFNAIQPIVKIIVDQPLDPDSHFALAAIYRQISRRNKVFSLPLNIEVNSKRTILSFRVETDEDLFTTAYVMIFPFKAATLIQNYLLELFDNIYQNHFKNLDVRTSNRFAKIRSRLNQLKRLMSETITIDSQNQLLNLKFFNSPTQVITINSLGQEFNITDSLLSANNKYGFVMEEEKERNLLSNFRKNNRSHNNLLSFFKDVSE